MKNENTFVDSPQTVIVSLSIIPVPSIYTDLLV